MKFENIKELISLIDQSSLTEFEFKQNDVSLRLSKNDYPSFAGTAAPAPVEIPVEQSASVAVNTRKTAEETVGESIPEVEGKVVTSPIVGVVYLQANPEADPYITEGDQVAEGQVLCLVEAMKIMNEIKSEYSGKIVEILVENEQVVEYNQPLFRIV